MSDVFMQRFDVVAGAVHEDDEVSRRRESHPPPLAEPCGSLSAHTAPIAQPSGLRPNRQWANMLGYRRAVPASSSPARFSRRRSRLYFWQAQPTNILLMRRRRGYNMDL